LYGNFVSYKPYGKLKNVDFQQTIPGAAEAGRSAIQLNIRSVAVPENILHQIENPIPK